MILLIGLQGARGLPVFERLRQSRHNRHVFLYAFLYAFDLIELNGDDPRREPLDTRKATLASVLAKAVPGLRFNEPIEADGPTVFAHACNRPCGSERASREHH